MPIATNIKLIINFIFCLQKGLMQDIIFTTVTFSMMLILFKYFEVFGVNNLQAIIVNYITAGILALVSSQLNGITVSPIQMMSSDYTLPAIIIGVLFIITFNLLAFSTQKVGIAITTVANKMSMIIPVIVGVYFFNDEKSVLKFAGVFLAIIAIYFSSTSGGRLSFNKKYIFLIVLVFIGQGLADSTLSWAEEKKMIGPAETQAFFIAIFFSAAIFGAIYLLFEHFIKSHKLKFKNIFGGVMLGIPNFFALHFFMNALKSNVLESSQIFPIVNMGVIVLTAVSGIILFKQKLSMSNWYGILLAIAAIAMITFS